MPVNRDCPDIERLRQFLLGRIPCPDAEILEQHLSNCNRCGQVVASMSAEDYLVAAVRHARETPTEEPDGVLHDLMERLKKLQSGAAGPGPPRPLLTKTAAYPRDTGAMPPAASPWLQPKVGDEFGGFCLLARLGEGGMGIVYRALDQQLNREVALKVLKPEILAMAGACERFLAEARALAALKHDHVTKIYQVSEVNSVPFLAMELLEGESLQKRLQHEKPMAVAEVLRVGVETAEGLAAVHGTGRIHRDLKPANVWLEDGTAHIKLLDFGLALVQGEVADHDRGGILGTPAYMSPEQALADPLDHRSDLFSLGVLLYECVTGQQPFKKETTRETLRAVSNDEPAAARTVNPMVPRRLSDLLGRLMAKKPAGRPASAQAVAEEMRAMSGRLPWWWLAVAAVLLLGVTGTVALKSGPKPDQDGQAKPTVAALTVNLDVRIWKKADTTKGLRLDNPKALPLQAGDWLRVEVETNRLAFLYLFYLDAKGGISPSFPWRDYHWDQRPPEEKRKQLNLPEDPLKDGEPLLPGASGIEAVLVLVRAESLDAAQEQRLRQLFEKPPPPAVFDPLRGAVWLKAEDYFGNKVDRDRPDKNQAGTVLDPVERMRRLVRGELKWLGGEVRGVCFPFQGM